MKVHDPKLNRVWLIINRTLLFVALSFVIGLALWLYVLFVPFDIQGRNLLIWVQAAWAPPEGQSLARVIAYGCLIIGLLTTSLMYLVAVIRWSKNSAVQHRRGARLDAVED